jgi:hypothetical protein
MMEREYLELLSINRKLILKYIFKKWNKEAWTGLIGLRIGTRGGPL